MGDKQKKGKKRTLVKDKKVDLDKEQPEEAGQRGILPVRDFKKNLGCG